MNPYNRIWSDVETDKFQWDRMLNSNAYIRASGGTPAVDILPEPGLVDVSDLAIPLGLGVVKGAVKGAYSMAKADVMALQAKYAKVSPTPQRGINLARPGDYMNAEQIAAADAKFASIFPKGSADNVLENQAITRNPTRFKQNLPAVDNLPPDGLPIAPTRRSAFDTEANNLGGRIDNIADQKTRYDTIMSRKPLLDEDGFPMEYSHGSTNVFKEFGTSKVSKDDLVNPQNDWGNWSWHSPAPSYTRPYSRNELGKEVANSNSQKNYLFPEKVFDPQNKEQYKQLNTWLHSRPGAKNLDKRMIDDMTARIGDRRKGYSDSEKVFMRDFLEENGYDAQWIHHAGTRNIMMKDPNKIKNINNRGTFNLNTTDTMKAVVPGAGIGFATEEDIQKALGN